MTRWIGSLYLLCALCGCSSGPDMSQAKSYEVLKVKDIDVVDRTRKDAWIFSADAKTPEARAQTAMKAAQDLRNKYTVYVMRVFLIDNRDKPGEGGMLASAVWAPDGQGFSGVEKQQWEVVTTDDRGSHPYDPNKK